MTKLYPKLRFSGKNFSPKLFEQKFKVSFNLSEETGNKNKIGRINEEGYAFLEPPDDLENNETKWEWIFQTLESFHPTFLDYGIKEIILHLDVSYDEQCNIEFSNQDIKRLAKYNIYLTISCYR